MEKQHKKNKKKKSKAASHDPTFATSVIDKALDLPAEDLLRMAQEYLDALNITEAEKVLHHAVTKYPDNVNLLDTYAELKFSLGEAEKGIMLQKKSVELDPHSNGSKYLNLAEFLKGSESIKAYMKGIELLTTLSESLIMAGNTAEAEEKKKQISSAYAAIAEIYMTDCCDEEGAEEKCEKNLQLALSLDPFNGDALQCLANLRILRERDPEASALLDKILEQTFKEEISPFNADFSKQTARLLMEIERYPDCIKVLEKVISTSEDNVEAWYLLAYANFTAKNYAPARDCVKNVRELLAKPDLKDPEIEEATAELEAKLKEIDPLGVETMEEGEKAESYESISENEEKMEEEHH